MPLDVYSTALFFRIRLFVLLFTYALPLYDLYSSMYIPFWRDLNRSRNKRKGCELNTT